MSRKLPDYAPLLRSALTDVPAVERVDATFRLGGPVGAQSVVNLHTATTEATEVVRILDDALTRCATVLADVPHSGNLYLYCFDGEGMRHTLSEVDETMSVAISFGRLATRRLG